MPKKKSSSNNSLQNTDTSSHAQNLGDFLRISRESQNKSLEDISDATGILVNKLQALENNDQSELPAKVFVRGFIRMYAKQLDVDPQYALKLFEERQGSESTRQSTPTSLEGEKLATQLFDGTIIKYILFIVFIGSCFFMFDAYYPQITSYLEEQKKIKEKKQLTTVQETIIKNDKIKEAVPTPLSDKTTHRYEPKEKPISHEELISTPKEPLTEEQAKLANQPLNSNDPIETSNIDQIVTTDIDSHNNSTDSSLTTINPPSTPLTSPENPQEEFADTISNSVLESDSTAQKPIVIIEANKQKKIIQANTDGTSNSSTETSAEQKDEATIDLVDEFQQVLVVNFSEESWTRVSIDGQNPHEQIFQPGDSHIWQAHNNIDLYLGNAGGATLSLNGVPMPINNESGHTVRIQVP